MNETGASGFWRQIACDQHFVIWNFLKWKKKKHQTKLNPAFTFQLITHKEPLSLEPQY